jgi:hypothetical protein
MTPGRLGRFGVNVHFRAMPPQDCVGRPEGGDLPQEPSPESSAFGGKASALVVGQPEAAPVQLPLEDPVLLDQVVDDLLLVAVDPTLEGHEQHLQGVDIGRHWLIVPCLNPACVPGNAPPSIRTIRARRGSVLPTYRKDCVATSSSAASCRYVFTVQ